MHQTVQNIIMIEWVSNSHVRAASPLCSTASSFLCRNIFSAYLPWPVLGSKITNKPRNYVTVHYTLIDACCLLCYIESPGFRATSEVFGALIIRGIHEVTQCARNTSRKQLILTSVIHRPLFPPPVHLPLTDTLFPLYMATARPQSCIYFHSSRSPAEIVPPLWLVSIIYALIVLCLSPLCRQENRPAPIFQRCVSGVLCVWLRANVYVCVCGCVCVCVCEGGSQLNKQTLSLDKLCAFLKHLAPIQATVQFCVFNSQLYNRHHHTCCA